MDNLLAAASVIIVVSVLGLRLKPGSSAVFNSLSVLSPILAVLYYCAGSYLAQRFLEVPWWGGLLLAFLLINGAALLSVRPTR